MESAPQEEGFGALEEEEYEQLSEEEILAMDPEERRRRLLSCSCVKDPYADLPPEARPAGPPPMRGLCKVICPGCGKVYWTNRDTDWCFDCEPRRPDAG